MDLLSRLLEGMRPVLPTSIAIVVVIALSSTTFLGNIMARPQAPRGAGFPRRGFHPCGTLRRNLSLHDYNCSNRPVCFNPFSNVRVVSQPRILPERPISRSDKSAFVPRPK